VEPNYEKESDSTYRYLAPALANDLPARPWDVAPAYAASRSRDPAWGLNPHAASDRGMLAPLSTHPNSVAPATMDDRVCASPDCFAESNSTPAGRPARSRVQPDCCCSPNRCPQIPVARRHSEIASSPECHHLPARAGRDSRAHYLRRNRLAVAPADQDDATSDLRPGWSPGSICLKAHPPQASKIRDSEVPDSGHRVLV